MHFIPFVWVLLAVKVAAFSLHLSCFSFYITLSLLTGLFLSLFFLSSSSCHWMRMNGSWSLAPLPFSLPLSLYSIGFYQEFCPSFPTAAVTHKLWVQSERQTFQMIIIIVFNPTSVYFPSLFLSFDSIQTSSLFIIHGHAEKKTDWQTRKEQCHIMCYRMVGIKVGVVSREPGKKSRRHLSPVFHFLLSRNKSTNIKHQDTQEDHGGKNQRRSWTWMLLLQIKVILCYSYSQ